MLRSWRIASSPQPEGWAVFKSFLVPWVTQLWGTLSLTSRRSTGWLSPSCLHSQPAHWRILYCFLAVHDSFIHSPDLDGITTQIKYLHSGSASWKCQQRYSPFTINFCTTVMMILGWTLILAVLALPFSCTSTSWYYSSHFNNNICTRMRWMQAPCPSNAPSTLMCTQSPMKTKLQRKCNIVVMNIQCLWGLLPCLTSCRLVLISPEDHTYGILLRFVPGLWLH